MSRVKDLKSYLDKNHSFVVECLSNLKVLKVNKATLALFGLKNKKEVMKHLKTTFNNTSFKAFKKELLGIASNNIEFTEETEFIHANGSTINAIVKVVPILGTDKVVVSIIDITELKKIKNKLLEFQKITHLGTFIYDDKTDLFESSAICDRILGIDNNYTKDIKGWINLIYPDDYQKVQNLLDDNSVKTVFEELRIVRPKDKKMIWVSTSVVKEFEAKGKRLKITGTIQDITKRKLNEEKIKQSDAVLKRLDSLVIVGGLGGDIKFVSPNVEKFLGYKPKELLGQGWWQKTFDDKRNAKASKNMLDKFILENVAFKEEFNLRKVKTKKGAYKWIEWHPSIGENNTFISIGIDITKRKKEELTKEVIYNITKKANEALPQELFYDFIRLELGKLINTTNFYIALGNKESEYLTIPYMHDEKDRKSDFPKKNSLSGYVIDTQNSLLINKKNKKILEQGPTSKCWLGTPLIINNNVIGLMTVQSYTDENAYTQDDVTLLELVASNISQVIGKSQDLERINLLSHALIQSAEAVIITDVDGAIQYVNPGFSALSGYTEQEALGQNPRIIKSGDQPKVYYEKLWNTILCGDNWQGEFVNKRKDGTKYLVNANISPIKNKEGMITHFVGVQEDITEKRKLERDLIHAFIDAQEEEKINFGEDLHDGISQILSAEAMFIQVLIQQNKDVLNAQSLKYLESVKNLNIKAINEARSIAHGLMSKQLKENGLLKAIAHICKDYNGSKNIVFQYTHKGLKETDIAKAIKINIFRIIQEISTNTIRHSGAKKAKISLSKTQNNMLQLIYSDNGVGIDFEKMKQEKKGAGLKNIERRVTLLKGTYTLNSVLNKGVKYTIEVPLFNI